MAVSDISNWILGNRAGWDRVKLKHIFQVQNGSTPRSGEDSYWDGDIVWITPSDLGSLTSMTFYDSARKLTDEGFANSGTAMAPTGSIAVSTRAPIGHVAIGGIEFCTNQGCRSMVPLHYDDSKFFYYHLVAAKPLLQGLGRGSTFVELSSSNGICV
ncbi:MAG: restriction endonuclease subunit S, partial [Anaerolineales bacterium]|nr:restriction endonuclease subunit S [Anaerolineales bacterium]